MLFTMNFNVWLKWVDERLEYQNLKESLFQNVVPQEMANQLWQPLLVFGNMNERQRLEYVPSSSVMMLVKNGIGKEAPFSHLDEAIVYNSNETEIVLRHIQLSKFKCDFDLRYFPFDKQTCFVKVIICRNIKADNRRLKESYL